MGWQLIYTSASRLLEAGRSGFGTVARHREIPPLLAAAIERTSQFNRGPGLDESRIIYSHRHVTVSGSRYSVLSRIRSAGSDYTGRTNHIAHHLIFEAREIAAQGRESASPVDVMLSAPWLDRWEEQPRYLGVADELPLAGFNHRMELPAQSWDNLTGNSRSAALLATADAIRGAYLVWKNLDDQQPEWPLYLFGESLLLLPDRRWSISFTSNLQPSDEAADFQWRCLSSGSPLRSQAEQSGRPLFDLNGTLPSATGDLASVAENGPGAIRRTAQLHEADLAAEPRFASQTVTEASSPTVRAASPKIKPRNTSLNRPVPDWMRENPWWNRTITQRIALAMVAVGLLLIAAIGISKWKQYSDGAKEESLRGALRESLAKISIDPDKEGGSFQQDQNPSVNSLNRFITDFTARVNHRAEDATISDDQASALLKESQGIYRQDAVKIWIDSIGGAKSAPPIATSTSTNEKTVHALYSSQKPAIPMPAASTPKGTPPLSSPSLAQMAPTPKPISIEGMPSVQIYFVVSNGKSWALQLPPSLLAQDWILASGTSRYQLVRHASQLRINLQRDNAAFEINEDEIQASDDAPSPDPSYTLSGSNVSICVVAPGTTTPQLLKNTLTSGLYAQINGNGLNIEFEKPLLDRLQEILPQNKSLMLRFSNNFLGTGVAPEVPVIGWTADLSSYTQQFDSQIQSEEKSFRQAKIDRDAAEKFCTTLKNLQLKQSDLEQALLLGIPEASGTLPSLYNQGGKPSDIPLRLSKVCNALEFIMKEKKARDKFHDLAEIVSHDSELDLPDFFDQAKGALKKIATARTKKGPSADEDFDVEKINLFLNNLNDVFPKGHENVQPYLSKEEANISGLTENVQLLQKRWEEDSQSAPGVVRLRDELEAQAHQNGLASFKSPRFTCSLILSVSPRDSVSLVNFGTGGN
jgi:hypothetical protein